jgi:hypothetical protein
VIYADILTSCSLAAVLEIYTQHFYTSSSFLRNNSFIFADFSDFACGS